MYQGWSSEGGGEGLDSGFTLKVEWKRLPYTVNMAGEKEGSKGDSKASDLRTWGMELPLNEMKRLWKEQTGEQQSARGSVIDRLELRCPLTVVASG